MEKIEGVFESGTIAEINDFKIYYEIANDQLLQKTKSLVILLHEGLGSTGQWKDIPMKLAAKLNLPVLAYDRLGYGKSSQVEEHDSTFLTYEAECILPQLLKHLAYDGKVTLVGHSDGATVGLIYAALHPFKTDKVIVEAPHVFIEDETIEGIFQAIKMFKEGSLKILQNVHFPNFKNF